VIVEKPFTPTSAEAYELVDLAKTHDRLLTVYQNRRWDSDFLTLSQLIRSGTLGRIVDFQTHFDRHRPQASLTASWKTKVQPGGGAIYDLGTHLMDQVVHLFGAPTRVTAFVGSQREPNPSGFEDSCTVHLHYGKRDSGDGWGIMMVTARASVVSLEQRQLRYWVRGESGSFTKFHLDCQEDQLKAGMRPGEEGYGAESEDRFGTLTTMVEGEMCTRVVPTVEPATYSEYYRRFARALAGEADQLPVESAEAALVIRLVELAKESSSTGRTVDL
jgi:predicted dehydrogenase